jgi:hypothetical protein
MAGTITSIEKSNNPIGNRTRDLPTCSIVPLPPMQIIVCIKSIGSSLSEAARSRSKADSCL